MRTYVRPVGSCPTGKARYQDEIAARLVLVAAQTDGVIEERRREVRAYECRHCHGWHVTSQAQRTRRHR